MRYTLVVIASSTVVTLFGQETDKPRSTFDAGLQLNYTTDGSFQFSDSDWNRLTPGFANPNESDSAFEGYSERGYIYNLQFLEAACFRSLNIKAFQARKLTPMLYLTVGAGSHYGSSTSWQKDERFAYDTITYSHSGDQQFIDSVFVNEVRKSFRATNASTSLSFALQTNREKRFSFLFGLGVYTSFGQKGETSVSQSTRHYAVQAADSSGNYYSSVPGYYYFRDADTETRQTFQGPSVWQVGAKIPLGLDFVIGNQTHPFWHRCVVGLQGSLDYRRTVIQDYVDFGVFSASISLAVKYRING